MPHRRQLTAWKRQQPAFAAQLAAAKAFADHERRRYGPRRSRLRYDEDISDRIILAVIRGATLPEICANRAFPSRMALRRWRRDHPDFDGALKSAMKAGHRARGHARCGCTPELAQVICDRIREGASLHSLSKQPDMPGLFALYKWVRTRPDFAAAVARACEDRALTYLDQAVDLLDRAGPAATTRVNAIHKRLGRLNPYPGERKR